jgi:hypothetical protein
MGSCRNPTAAAREIPEISFLDQSKPTNFHRAEKIFPRIFASRFPLHATPRFVKRQFHNPLQINTVASVRIAVSKKQ